MKRHVCFIYTILYLQRCSRHSFVSAVRLWPSQWLRGALRRHGRHGSELLHLRWAKKVPGIPWTEDISDRLGKRLGWNRMKPAQFWDVLDPQVITLTYLTYSNILWDYLDVVTQGILGHHPNLWPAPEFSPQGHQLGLLRWRPDVDKVRRLFGHEAGEVEEVGVHSRGFGLKPSEESQFSFGISSSVIKGRDFPKVSWGFPHVFPNWKGHVNACHVSHPAALLPQHCRWEPVQV